jgi:hypothetical protein
MALLQGCGNSTTSQEYRLALQSLGGLVSPADAPPPEAVGRASFQVVPGPLIFVTLPEFDVAAPMVPFGENSGVRTWSTAEKQTLTLRSGIMTSTRGLGDDLMQSAVDPVGRAIAAGSGRDVPRTTWHLDGNDRLIERRFLCGVRTEGRETITLVSGQRMPATRVSEDCAADGVSFSNTYWKDESGTVRRSRQWVSPLVGYAEIEVLRL